MEDLTVLSQVFLLISAEGVGFEPTVALAGHNGFRDRPNRPLWHPSVTSPALYQFVEH